MLSPAPLLNAVDVRNARKPSLKFEQMYAGHSLEKKLKSNFTPLALAGALSVSLTRITSFTRLSIGQPAAGLGKPGGSEPLSCHFFPTGVCPPNGAFADPLNS